jgi:hypothetical protein
MAKLDQPVVGLDTRASVTFSPTMTLEVYMQTVLRRRTLQRLRGVRRPAQQQRRGLWPRPGTITASRDADGVVNH